MAGNNYDTQSQRIGRFKGRILKHALPQEVLGRVGASVKEKIPKNNSNNVAFRRWLPKGATTSTPNTWSVDPAAHLLTEGETPNAESITAQDITATLSEYGVLYRFSNRVSDMYEDDIPVAMKRLTGERMGLLLEMIRYGVLKAGTNVFRSGGVASRSLVTALLGAGLFRAVARSLSNNLAMKITNVLSASPNIGTQPIEAAFIAVCHTDVEADIRAQLSGFVHVSEYGNRRPIHENELGSWEQFRFVTSPHLNPYLLAGTTATQNTRLANGVANSAGTELVDVYPILVLSEESYGDVMLRGMDSFDVSMIAAGVKTKDDPLGQRGVVGASTYFTAVRLNELQMAVVEVAVSYQT
jgi:N4-gp56 family major capsid protein